MQHINNTNLSTLTNGVANSALSQGSQSPSEKESDSVRSANSEIGSPGNAEQHGWINAIEGEFPQMNAEKTADHAKKNEVPNIGKICADPRFLSAEICGKQEDHENRDTEARRKAEEEIGVANSALPQGSQSPSKSEADSVRSANSEIGSPDPGDQRQTDKTPKRQNDPTLADFPELLELFGRPQNIPLDRSQLPDEINSYLDLVGKITDAQDGAKLTAFLPVIAANIGNRIYMYNAGTKHFCNVWAAIIGPSTVSRKTTVINQAMKMLKPFKDGLLELSAKERNERDIELSRVTQARMYNLLAINPNRLLLHMELSAWMQEMGKAYNAGMKQEITDMFDGKDRSIAKMEIDEYIRRPAFSIVGATTEDWFFRELREVADQRGGFLQRFIICIIQNVDVNELRFDSMPSAEFDTRLHAWDEALSVFRSLPDSRQLLADEAARDFRDVIYRELMENIALNANDPQAAYCARIFDNYFWRFCILIFAIKRWQDIREARDNDHLEAWFARNRVDEQTAKEAWYLCEYYFQNTQPFLRALMEGYKLDKERKIIRILQKAPDQRMDHSRLLCKTCLTAREFRACIESLIERQAILAHEQEVGYRNRVCFSYSLNPVLKDLDLN